MGCARRWARCPRTVVVSRRHGVHGPAVCPLSPLQLQPALTSSGSLLPSRRGISWFPILTRFPSAQGLSRSPFLMLGCPVLPLCTHLSDLSPIMTPSLGEPSLTSSHHCTLHLSFTAFPPGAILHLSVKSLDEHLSPVLDHNLCETGPVAGYSDDCCVPSIQHNVCHRIHV